MAAIWFVLVGSVFLLMAVSASALKRLPLTSSMLYLAVGYAMARTGMLTLDPIAEAPLLERIAEIAVLISLFTAGLKLRPPLTDPRWRPPARLAVLAMALTVLGLAALGRFGLGLPLGAAILLGAVLAPTDPVLASDVQVTDASDRDRLRFSLTGEAGLNDGAAFPFVMLGLGLLGLHEIGAMGWRWIVVDVVWAVAAGLGIGALLGSAVGRLVVHLRREHREAVGLDDFLSLGLVALSYGAALLAHAYGFLAVFAAGLALRRIERREHDGTRAPPDITAAAQAGTADEIATDPEHATTYMTQAVLGFNEQIERVFEVVVVVLIGALLPTISAPWDAVWFVPALFLVVRPLATSLGLLGSDVSGPRRGYIAWFGIRGAGSIYYVLYAVNHGLEPDVARRLVDLTLLTVATSIVAHGLSVTPLMKLYQRRVAAPRQGGG